MKYLPFVILFLIFTNFSFAQNIPNFDLKLQASLLAKCKNKCTNAACHQECNNKYGSPTSFTPPSESNQTNVQAQKKNTHNYCIKKCGCKGRKCILRKRKICYNKCRG